MSMWKYMAALEGWNKAHNPDADNSLSSGEVDELWEWLNDGD